MHEIMKRRSISIERRVSDDGLQSNREGAFFSGWREGPGRRLVPAAQTWSEGVQDRAIRDGHHCGYLPLLTIIIFRIPIP